jgi:predicted nucleic acid-binding protein
VDASVALKWFLPEALSLNARTLLTDGFELLAPDLITLEVANAAWKRHRRRELDELSARQLVRDLTRFPLVLHGTAHWTGQALEIAMRHGLTVYDSMYLAIAAGERCRVVTADRRLYESCRSGGLARLVTWLGELE